MIDGGKLHDWLQARDIDLIHWRKDCNSVCLTRSEFEELFRQYVAELTGG